ncbi:lipopolysaccharide biosynthesis protein [Pseudomonas brenneri]|uniref:lipopolysaccharide biosynthesis protein n=1 Tax=Pseudomonas brenneri TaxID=129817 RepID=UPI003570A0B6
MKLQQNAKLNYAKEIWGSLFFKMLAIVCSFLLLPLMLRYLGGDQFGVWVAIFSVVSWVIFFDLGFGSGLRNKLSESLSRNDLIESSVLISTAYGAMAVLSFLLCSIFLVVNFFIDWQGVFNTHVASLSELRWSMAIIVVLFLVNFSLLIVLQVLHASKKTSLTVAHQFLANFIALIAILVLKIFIAPSLLVICLTYGLSQVLTTLLVSILFYRNAPNLMPRFRLFDLDRVRGIATLGGQFFIIQLAVLVIFSTDKIIVIKLFGPASLTEYELVFKAYSIILIMNTLFLAPLWSRYTHAAANHDYKWMSKTLGKSHWVCAVLFFPALILCLFGHDIIFLWAGYNIDASFNLLVAMFIFILLRVWSDIYAYFLNGVGMLKVQMWLAVFQAIINIPLSVTLGKMYGVSGVVYGSVATLSVSAILLPICAYHYLKLNDLCADK